MGRILYGSAPDIFELFRFTGTGMRLFSGANTAPSAYFSIDGGNTKLADYGKTSDPSDFLNSGVQGSTDPFDEFYGGSTIENLSTVDKEQLVALGFHLATAPVTTTTIESIGSTSLVQVGSSYFLNSISSGSGPEKLPRHCGNVGGLGADCRGTDSRRLRCDMEKCHCGSIQCVEYRQRRQLHGASHRGRVRKQY
jgi:hypothetical protein